MNFPDKSNKFCGRIYELPTVVGQIFLYNKNIYNIILLLLFFEYTKYIIKINRRSIHALIFSVKITEENVLFFFAVRVTERNN